MTKLIKDILPLGAGIGEFTKLDFGMDESDWRAAEGKSGSYIIGWWEGKSARWRFRKPRPTKLCGSSRGRIALTDVEGNRKIRAGPGLPAAGRLRGPLGDDRGREEVLLLEKS